MSSEGPSFALDKCWTGAQLELVTFATQFEPDRPTFLGVTKRDQHCKQLTLRNPSVREIAFLAMIYPDARVIQCDVAVDLWPTGDRGYNRMRVLEACQGMVSEHLFPFGAPLMGDAIMTTNASPLEGDSTLPDLSFVSKENGSAEVLVYVKEHKAGPYADTVYSVRLAVRLRSEACFNMELCRLEDFFTFGFRRQLAPYFRMVKTRSPQNSGDRHNRLAPVNQLIGSALSNLQRRFDTQVMREAYRVASSVRERLADSQAPRPRGLGARLFDRLLRAEIAA